MSKNDAPLLGIFGGSFDPIHLGHLQGLWEVTQQVPFERVHIIPCAQSPIKQAVQATAEQRIAMLQLAIQDQPTWQLDDREITRGGNSYTVDTLKSLHTEFPEHRLCLIIGMDVAIRLLEWRNWQQILTFAHLIVMTRPECDPPQTPWLLELQRRTVQEISSLRMQKAGRVFWQKITALAISATRIRQLSSENNPPPFLLPTAVWNYIQQHKLYCSEQEIQ